MNDSAISSAIGSRQFAPSASSHRIERPRVAAANGDITARALGAATFAMAAMAVLSQFRKAAPDRNVPALPASAPESSSLASSSRILHASAALLATSVLADSAIEHYRGEFENPGMLTPLVTALATALASGFGALSPSGRSRLARNGVYASAFAAGALGSAFHVYNVLHRPGGFSWGNLFYAAPLGAPAALSLAGLLGLAARRISDAPEASGAISPRLAGYPAGRALSALVSTGLAGTTTEVALLHFRGAFHNPFMWLPVTMPPVASVLLGTTAIVPGQRRVRRLTRVWLALTGLLGMGGVGFHAYGVGRQMGGWRNLAQNVLSGPPLSAPPAYTALALAGFAALRLIDQGRHGAGAAS